MTIKKCSRINFKMKIKKTKIIFNPSSRMNNPIAQPLKSIGQTTTQMT